MRIENDYANELLINVRQNKQVQAFMDAVSGIENYTTTNLKRQGHVFDLVRKDLTNHHQYLYDRHDLVSVFWETVFKYLPKAKLFGPPAEKNGDTVEDAGKYSQNNPMYYLRMQGQFGVRNYVVNVYRKNIKKQCIACGYTGVQDHKHTCPKCQSHTQTVTQHVYDGVVQLATQPAVDVSTDENMIQGLLHDLMMEFQQQLQHNGKETRSAQIVGLLVNNPDTEDGYLDFENVVNYCQAIGDKLGVNKTFVASRMSRIRSNMIDFIVSHPSEAADHMKIAMRNVGLI